MRGKIEDDVERFNSMWDNRVIKVLNPSEKLQPKSFNQKRANCTSLLDMAKGYQKQFWRAFYNIKLDHIDKNVFIDLSAKVKYLRLDFFKPHITCNVYKIYTKRSEH